MVDIPASMSPADLSFSSSIMMEEGGVIHQDDDDPKDSSYFSTASNSTENVGGATSRASSIQTKDEDPAASIRPLIHRESNWLSNARMFMIFVLVVGTGSSAIGTHLFMWKLERDDFKVRYTDFANQILSVSQINAKHSFQTYESMSLQMTLYVQRNTQGLEWPNVIFPDYGAIVHKGMETTGATYIGYTPLVTNEQRTSYEEYTSYPANQGWIQSDASYRFVSPPDIGKNSTTYVSPFIYVFENNETSSSDGEIVVPEVERDLYAPVAQVSPLDLTGQLLNYNAFDFPYFKSVFDGMLEADRAVLSEVLNLDDYVVVDMNGTTTTGDDYDDDLRADLVDDSIQTEFLQYSWPARFMAAPIYDRIIVDDISGVGNTTTGNKRKLVGALTAEMPWHSYFQNLIPEGVNGLILVVRNTCNQSFTYQIDGPTVTYLGPSDLHDKSYKRYEVEATFTAFTSIEECTYSFHVYPSRILEAAYETHRPITFTIAVVVIFLEVIVVFFVYDWLVERRQEKVMTSAIRTNAIVNSLFPAHIKERLMDDAVPTTATNKQRQAPHTANNKKDSRAVMRILQATTTQSSNEDPTSTEKKQQQHQPTTVDNQDSSSHGMYHSKYKVYDSKPIADLFPHSSVLFGDLVGFTAWSSAREPHQVFVLLETLYNSFDKIARKLGVFKVETIGDCYMAATGLPDPRDDHAVAMARFARHCLYELYNLLNSLTNELGPGTDELAMRFGIHSGPVTAGVLRGEKSRFQLFGDTVNTAARMESTGSPHKIQVSQQTAELLIAAGKSHWIKAREDLVTAKGKGQLQTYWVAIRPPTGTRSSLSSSNGGSTPAELESSHSQFNNNEHSEFMNDNSPEDAPKIPSSSTFKGSNPVRSDISNKDRLIAWNADVLEGLLKQIVATRRPKTRSVYDRANSSELMKLNPKRTRQSILDEVCDTITFPQTAPPKFYQGPSTIELSSIVINQLHDYVQSIAGLYNNDNPYHSFGHACHVVQSVTKLLARVGNGHNKQHAKDDNETKSPSPSLAIDPLTQFACVFAALIHDVDHYGLTNTQLIQQETEIAKVYNNACSISQQNSFDVGWELFMERRYDELRACLCSTMEDMNLFRQLVINLVMATDIQDQAMNMTRHKRWEAAFDNCSRNDNRELMINRKKTMVIEHLLQTSTLAHTMQHWQLYLKWNNRLFVERYEAHMKTKDNVVDPSLKTWYEYELKYFDDIVIPMSKKLHQCNLVSTVVADEYYAYAISNRNEWQEKGRDIVTQLKQELTSSRNSSKPAE